MPSPDQALKLGYGAIVVLVLLSALFWPRAGEPALLLPLAAKGTQPGLVPALAWVADEGARIESIDPFTSRIVVRAPSGASLLRALRDGMLPIAADGSGCTAPTRSGELL